MKKIRSFWSNKNAVSEEFTSLPALAMVMIGITVFLVILSNAYTSFEMQTNQVEQIKQAEYISSQLLNPTVPFITSKGSIDLEIFQQKTGEKYLSSLKESMNILALNFTTKLSFQNKSFYVPHPPPTRIQNIIGYSNFITVDLNEMYTCPAVITVLTWEE